MTKRLKKVSNYESFDDWVADLIQQTPNGIDNFLKTSFEEFLKDGNEKALLIALRQVAKAKGGLRDLANKTGIQRESLYRALSERGNPRLSTLTSIMSALGYNLSLKPIHHRH
jgi:probable addiction module antidote protein